MHRVPGVADTALPPAFLRNEVGPRSEKGDVMKRIYTGLLIFCLGMVLFGCQKKEAAAPEGAAKKLTVVTTLFPLYDFARAVAGDKATIQLLLPPGVEPHSFEPKPEDMVRVSKADLVVYTSEHMEPWAVKMLQTIATKPVVVDASKGAVLLKAGPEEAGHEHEHDHGGIDPHIWLDFANARVMVQNIADGLIAKDPANKAFYAANALAYQGELTKLDQEYQAGLSNCGKKVFLHGGHFAFGYLAKRYGLSYHSAQAINPDSEPTPAKIAQLIREMRSNDLKYVYCEELLSPATAEMIARETGAQVLLLNAAHNISKEDFDKQVTFVSLMRQNLVNLRKGLQCPL
jgi:zinc transport system substrate-binding protein